MDHPILVSRTNAFTNEKVVVDDISESFAFGSSLHAYFKYVIGFVLGCLEVPQTIHFLFLASRKKRPPAGVGIALFFWLKRISKPKCRSERQATLRRGFSTEEGWPLPTSEEGKEPSEAVTCSSAKSGLNNET